MRPLLLSSLLALAGCYSSGPAPTPPIEAGLACAPGELALAWQDDDGEFSGAFHPASLRVAPGGALLERRAEFRSQVVRMGDGEPIAPVEGVELDAAWARGIELDPESGIATVRAVATGEVLLEVERLPVGDGWQSSTVPALTPDGARAILLECQSSPSTSEARAIVRVVPLSGGEEVRTTLALVCGEPFGAGAPRLFASAGHVLLAGLREPGPAWLDDGPAPALGLARIDLASGDAITAFPSDDTSVPLIGPPPAAGSLERAIVGVASSEREIAIVASDGMLRRLDAATLAPIADPIAVPVFVANWETFVPSAESPVAYSADGALLAHAGEGGAIVLRDTATSAIVATLALPFGERPGGGIAPPMAIAVIDDGVIVTTSHGLARWACGGEVAPIARPSGELAVRASGPASARAGEPIRFSVEVENATLPVVRFARIEGGGSNGTFGPELLAYSGSSGTIDVEIVADDGARTARTTARIDVAPAP